MTLILLLIIFGLKPLAYLFAILCEAAVKSASFFSDRIEATNS